MANTNIEWLSMSDESIVFKIGEFIKHQRLIQKIRANGRSKSTAAN